MSGGFVAYHLRPGKAVDRALFVDLLTRLNGWRPINQHTYVGFGGPFLEDYKIIHTHFDITSMISLEMDEDVFKRQKFNQPLKCIKCRNITSKEFINDFSFRKNAIIWLDYATPERRQQLQEVQALVPKLNEFDILKITFNANPRTLYDKPVKSPEELRQKRFDKLSKRLEEFLPNDVGPEDTENKAFARLIGRIAAFAVSKSLRGHGLCLQHLTSFYYQDSYHQMLTLAGVVLKVGARKSFLKNTGLADWKLCTCQWANPMRINVPALSVKERQFIDRWLPKHPIDKIQAKLKFPVAKKSKDAREALEDYAKYYRHYPNFLKVVV